MHVRSVLVHAVLLAAVLLARPANAVLYEGLVYEDNDGNGQQGGIDEPGIPGVDVVITDSSSVVLTVTTDQDGKYQAEVPPGRIDINIEDSTLPPGPWLQTDGSDPSSHTPPTFQRDGYCWPASSPTGCCESNKKKIRIRWFLNRSGSLFNGVVATIDRATLDPWNSYFVSPRLIPSGPTKYSVRSNRWLQDKMMGTSITVGFQCLIGAMYSVINTPLIASTDWHIKRCGTYKVRIWMNLGSTPPYDVKTKFDANCHNNMYPNSGATSWVCWELEVMAI